MKKLLLLLIMILGIFQSVSAQIKTYASNKTNEEEKTAIASEPINPNAPVKGEIIDNTVTGLKLYQIYIPLWSGMLSKFNSSLYNLSTGGLVNFDKFSIEVEYNYMFGDRFLVDYGINEYNRADIVMPVTKSNSTNYGRIYGTYYFMNKEKLKETTVGLKTEGRVNYVTNVPAYRNTRYGVNLGFEHGVAFYGLNQRELYGQAIDNPNEPLKTFGYNYQSAMTRYSFLSLGFSIANTENVTVQFENYGKRRSAGMGIFNFDLLIAVQNNYENVYGSYDYISESSNNIHFLKEYNINDYNKKTMVGGRVYYRSVPLKGVITFNAEIGYQPGFIKQNNLYAKFVLQLALGNNLKKK